MDSHSALQLLNIFFNAFFCQKTTYSQIKNLIWVKCWICIFIITTRPVPGIFPLILSDAGEHTSASAVRYQQHSSSPGAQNDSVRGCWRLQWASA